MRRCLTAARRGLRRGWPLVLTLVVLVQVASLYGDFQLFGSELSVWLSKASLPQPSQPGHLPAGDPAQRGDRDGGALAAAAAAKRAKRAAVEAAEAEAEAAAAAVARAADEEKAAAEAVASAKAAQAAAEAAEILEREEREEREKAAEQERRAAEQRRRDEAEKEERNRRAAAAAAKKKKQAADDEENEKRMKEKAKEDKDGVAAAAAAAAVAAPRQSPAEIHPYLLEYAEHKSAFVRMSERGECGIRISSDTACAAGVLALRTDGWSDVDAHCLLNWKRFDMTAKFMYARFARFRVDSNWARKVYLASIDFMNGYCEGYDRRASGADPKGGPCSKEGAHAFIDSFENVLRGMRSGGFTPTKDVPVDAGLSPSDGAHRVAAAHAFATPVPVRVRRQMEECLAFSWNHEWFAFRGLPERTADAMALEYVLAKSRTTRIVAVFPGAEGRDEELSATVAELADVVYRKDVVLRGAAPALFVDHFYPDAPSPWRGVRRRKCFDDRSGFQRGNALRVFFVESTAPELERLVQRVGELFAVAENGVDVTEGDRATEYVSKLLLNANSLAFANELTSVDNAAHRFSVKRLEGFIAWSQARTHLYEREFFAVGAKLSLGLLGDRPPDSSAFRIVRSRNAVVAAFDAPPRAGDHDADDFEAVVRFRRPDEGLTDAFFERVREHKTTEDELLFDPHFHFYFKGIKLLVREVARLLLDSAPQQSTKI